MHYVLKTLISAVVIVAVSEFAKRSGFIGGLIASLPIVSILAILWLYVETKDIEKVISLSTGIFWMVIPSLVFFILLPLLLKRAIPFYFALAVSCFLTALIYYGAYVLYRKIGISLE